MIGVLDNCQLPANDDIERQLFAAGAPPALDGPDVFNTLSRLSDPQRRLTPQLADSLVDAFLYGVATGRRKTPEIPDAL